MKTKSVLAMLVASGLLMFGLNSRANDGPNDGDDSSSDSHHENDGDDDGCQGGQIDGSEMLIAKVAMLPTTNAAGASGCARLEAKNEDGVVTSRLSLKLFGLVTGIYPLSIVKKSDGSSVVIAQIEIGGGCDGEEDGDDGDNEGSDRSTHSTASPGNGVFVSDEDLTLPSEVDPMDIAQIVLSDSNGNQLLVGDLVNAAPATSIRFRAALRVGGSTISTTAQTTGKAHALSTTGKARRTDHFIMIASGVPASTTFTLQVNGEDAGTVISNRKGKVLVRKLPQDLLMLRSVRLVDATGQTAAKANF